MGWGGGDGVFSAKHYILSVNKLAITSFNFFYFIGGGIEVCVGRRKWTNGGQMDDENLKKK